MLAVAPTIQTDSRWRKRRAFTLIDVLVSIAVIAVLIGLLIPSLGTVHETARRVACQSNVRQIGLGVVMYADDNHGLLPPSVFLPPAGVSVRGNSASRFQSMLTLRLDPAQRTAQSNGWDGLGELYAAEYIPAPKVFYCPSHRGENPYSRFAPTWDDSATEIVCNYHFRGEGPAGVSSAIPTRNLYQIDPAQSSLIADGMRVQSDCNHRIGVNFFRADLTVHWYSDPAMNLLATLPVSKESATDSAPVLDAWDRFDQYANQAH